MTKILLTPRDVAARLNLRPVTVLRWANDGRIPSIRLSSTVIRFDWDAVLEALGVGVTAKGEEGCNS